MVVLRRPIRSRKRRVPASAGTTPEPTSLLTATTSAGGPGPGAGEVVDALLDHLGARLRSVQMSQASIVRDSQRVRQSISSGGPEASSSGTRSIVSASPQVAGGAPVRAIRSAHSASEPSPPVRRTRCRGAGEEALGRGDLPERAAEDQVRCDGRVRPGTVPSGVSTSYRRPASPDVCRVVRGAAAGSSDRRLGRQAICSPRDLEDHGYVEGRLAGGTAERGQDRPPEHQHQYGAQHARAGCPSPARWRPRTGGTGAGSPRSGSPGTNEKSLPKVAYGQNHRFITTP